MTELLTTIAGVGRVLIAVAVTLLVGSMAGLVLLGLRRSGSKEDDTGDDTRMTPKTLPPGLPVPCDRRHLPSGSASGVWGSGRKSSGRPSSCP